MNILFFNVIILTQQKNIICKYKHLDMQITAYKLCEFLAVIENIYKLCKIQLYLVLITEHYVSFWH